MKLEELNLVELNAQEVQETEGGNIVPGWLWQAAVATFAYNVIADWKENVKAYEIGRKAGLE